MTKEIITLTIDRLAGLGDGNGTCGERKVFVPLTLAGEVVEAEIVKEIAGVTYCKLVKIITPSPDRKEPICKHFGECGGCTLQHLNDNLYPQFKRKIAAEALRKAGYSDENLAETVKIPLASRRRVNLKTKEGKIGFYIENSHQLVDIEECKIIEPGLFDLILALKPQVKKFPDINSIQINAIDGRYDVVLASKNRVNLSKFERIAGVKRLSSSVNGKISAVYQDGDAAITLAGLSIRIPQSAFLQASKEAAEAMSNLVLQAVGNAEKIADLFAGIGAYSFALAKQADVTAFEIDAAMVTTINNAAKIYKLNDKLKAEKRDLFKEPIGYYALKNYDAIVINPPRSGAKAQIEQIAIAKTPKVVMISCNHATFARDAKILKDAGYKLDRLTPIDQFVYTPHLELVGEFSI